MEALKNIFIEKIGLELYQYERLIAELKTKTLRKKEHLIQEGSVCDFIGIVSNGKLRSYVQNDENEFNNDFYLENTFISAYTSFLTQSPTNCNIEALTDCEVNYISFSQLNRLIAEDPIDAVHTALNQLLGNLHPVSYVAIQEMKADAYGYEGLTIEYKIINNKINNHLKK